MNIRDIGNRTIEEMEEILHRNIAFAGREATTDDYMVVFHGWEDIGSTVMACNELDGLPYGELVVLVMSLGVKDPHYYIEHLHEDGEVRIGSNGYSVFNGGKGRFEPLFLDIEDIIQKIHGEDAWMGFSDEYSTCDKCLSVVRTSPDSYGWAPPYIQDDDGILCAKCLEEDPQIYIDHLKNELRGSSDVDIDIEDYGWVIVNDDSLENGFHRGQDDTPDPILESFNEHDIDVIFQTYSSQFSISFDIYVKEEDLDRAQEVYYNTNHVLPMDQSPSYLMEKGLKEATVKMSELPEDSGIKYAKVSGDGTASVRTVSPQEFVDGIKD